MNKQGFRLIELRVTGNNKKDAIVSFQKGLNVISGPSDTGKSYIYECINYMLGSSNRPQPLEKEDIGYEHIYLCIKSYIGEVFTIKRDFDSNHFLVWDKEYSRAMASTDYKTFSLTNRSHPEKQISNFYMKLVNGNGLIIKNNQQGKTGNLTFSLIRPFFQVNETKIQARESFLLHGDRTITAKQRSSFRSFLTTLDDKDCKEVEKKEVQVAKIAGKLEYLEEQERKLTERISDKEEKLKKMDADEIKSKINDLSEIISIESKNISDSTSKRFELWNELKGLESRLIYNQELLERFNLLNDTYSDDLSRLEFIEEGHHYYSQLVDINCPTCNQPLPEQVDTLENELSGLEAEKKSIEKRVSDLLSTIDNVSSENERIENDINKLKTEIRSIDTQLNSELKSKIELSKDELSKFELINRDFDFLAKDIEDLAEVKARISHYSEIKISGTQKTDYTNDLEGSLYVNLSSEIYKILESWHYNDLGDVSFDDDIDDFKINGKSRLSHGKGHRALLYAAYLIGTLKYCQLEEIKSLHPNLVIIDSPLTAYKKEELSDIPKDDIITHDTESEFFKSLAELKESQIIIFDNKEPFNVSDEEVNHIHFTKNKAEGRYGFFPV